MAEHLAVNQGVVGASAIASAIYGLLEKRLNSHAFHACIHGFESRTGHQMEESGLMKISPFFFFCERFCVFLSIMVEGKK